MEYCSSSTYMDHTWRNMRDFDRVHKDFVHLRNRLFFISFWSTHKVLEDLVPFIENHFFLSGFLRFRYTCRHASFLPFLNIILLLDSKKKS